MADRPEPNGWELLGAVQRVESRLDGFTKGFVSSELFGLFQKQVADDRAADRQQIAELKAQIAEADKEKARNRFALALSIIAVVAAIITPIVQHALGVVS